MAVGKGLASRMNRRLHIERPVARPDAHGNEIPVFDPVASVAAQRLDQRATEAWRGGGTAASLETAFVIRWSSRVAEIGPRWRVWEGDRVYQVTGVTEVGRREAIQIVCVTDPDQAEARRG